MRKLALCLSLLIASSAFGAQPLDRDDKDGPDFSATTTPTESMWFYQQEMKRYDNPRMQVRRAAELRAAERRVRLTAMRWLGYSKVRPTIAPVQQQVPNRFVPLAYGSTLSSPRYYFTAP